MNGWSARKLGELTTKIGSGATPRGGSSVYTSSGVALIRSQNVLDNVMKNQDIAYITDGAARALQGVTVKERDVLINITGDSIARCCVVDPSVLPARVNQHVSIIRVTPELDPRFLQRFLVNPSFKEQLLSFSSGGTRNALTKADLSNLIVHFPDIDEQQAVAEVLGALDDKISANTKVITTADQLSHALFLSMSRSGSQLVPLSETAKFVNGKAFTKNASGTGRVVIRISELNSGIGGSTVYNDIDVEEQHLARSGDLLFAWSGSLTLHRWFRPEGIVNQHIFKVIPNNGYPHWLVHELLRHKLEEFKSIAADKATTMGHIQRKHLDEPVAVPTLEEIHDHGELMTVLWERSLAAEVETLKLAATRDALLPQLMSGKLRVKDAEKVLEDAGV